MTQLQISLTDKENNPYKNNNENTPDKEFNSLQQHGEKSRVRKIALVVEGGGMRTIFSAGVLDSFFELGFDPFHLYFGVSAGALNLTSYLAGQYLRNYHVVMLCASSGQFISSWKYLRGGHFVDLDWLSNQCLKYHPLDKQGAMQNLKNSGKKFVVVCTNIKTGEANYHSPTDKNFYTILKGSCCVPLLYRKPVYISGVQVIDGGITDPLPVKKAFAEGATEIVVIRTREKSYRESKNSLEKKLGSYLYRRYPQLQKSILELADTYNESISFIENPPANIKIFQIAPTRNLGIHLVTTDPVLLEKDYRHGNQLGREFASKRQAISDMEITSELQNNPILETSLCRIFQ